MSRRWIVAIVAAVALVCACAADAAIPTRRAAATAAATPLSVVTQTGDGYNDVAAFLAPGASAADLTTFAHYLARANGGTDSTSITTSLQEGRILWYLQSRIPAPVATSTTSTAPSTSTSTSTTSTTVAPSSTSSTSSTSTTSTVAPSTSSSTTSTTSSTTAPTTSTTTPAGGPACGLASAAFCDTFDVPHNGGTQTGDLDPAIWGVSRIAHNGSGHNNGITPSHNPCAGTGFVAPPNDAKICNGQYVESNNDGGSVTGIMSYPKQPFDFTGRTGTVVFDVSNDTSGAHGAWPDFVITDEPVPAPAECISECNLEQDSTPVAKNEVGFAMSSSNEESGRWGITRFWYTKNGVLDDLDSTEYGDLSKGSRTAMNHIEVHVSTTRIDVYGTEAGSTVLKHVAGADIPTLGFSKGLVWINDVHYNARKAIEPGETGTLFDHSFAWDNLGFDGPKTYRDLGFDVPLAKVVTNGTNQNGDDVEVNEGYASGTGQTFTVTGVNWKQPYDTAKVVLDAYAEAGAGGIPLSVSLNGNPAVSTTIANYHGQARSFAFPSSQVVAGTNTIRITSTNGAMIVFNVSLILVAAAPVP